MKTTSLGPAAGFGGLLLCGTALLSGCFVIGEGAPREAELANEWSGDITLRLVGVDAPVSGFPAYSGRLESLPIRGVDGASISGDEPCVGDGFVVSDATGRVLGRSEEPVCPDTLVHVAADGEVTW